MNIYEQKQNMEEAFEVYLKECCGINNDIGIYKTIIEKCLKEKEEGGIPLNYNKIDELKELIEKIIYDETENNSEDLEDETVSYTEALEKYRDFLTSYKFFKEWVKPRKLNIDDEDGFARNTIVFGAPGTGKSHSIEVFLDKKKATSTDVTFHPDTDYASFVGCYKPTKDVDGNLTYEFVPQAFIKAYLEAWRLPKDQIHVLRIEEINRGNCAQIFGDIFQLLDRFEEDSEKGTKGYSKYTVDTDTDLMNYLKPELAECDFSEIKDERVRENVKTGKKLILPSNLWILATMNTSDQSLYPMDSAFKRRWEWKYIPISYDVRVKYIVTDEKSKIGYNWWEFLQKINSRILDATKSEDKQLGFWFTGESQTVSISSFVNKVLFYLWNDVFKDYHDSNSPFGELTFQQFYGNAGIDDEKVKKFIKNLGLTEESNVYLKIEENRKKIEKAKSSRASKLRVTFLDGTIISDRESDAKILEEVLEIVLEKVGSEKVRSLNIQVSGCPLVSPNIEDFKEKYRAGVQAHRLPKSGMFVFTTSNIDQKTNQLKLISKGTGLNFKVENTSKIVFPNENPD